MHAFFVAVVRSYTAELAMHSYTRAASDITCMDTHAHVQCWHGIRTLVSKAPEFLQHPRPDLASLPGI